MINLEIRRKMAFTPKKTLFLGYMITLTRILLSIYDPVKVNEIFERSVKQILQGIKEELKNDKNDL